MSTATMSAVPGVTTQYATAVRRARPSDVHALHGLLQLYAEQGLVLPRTVEQVVRHFREYIVVEDGAGIIGCASLRVYSPELGEVCSLAVAPRSQGHGVGRLLVETLLAEARSLALHRVFAMTGQEGFFRQLGFERVPLESIPEKVAADEAEGIDRVLHPRLAVLCELGT